MIRLITVILISLFLFVNFAHADESYNITSCWSGDVTMLSASKELVIFGYDLKGVSRSNDQSTAFDNCSLQIVGTVKIESGKYSSQFLIKRRSV
jgi:hypothetical protein